MHKLNETLILNYYLYIPIKEEIIIFDCWSMWRWKDNVYQHHLQIIYLMLNWKIISDS